MKNPRVSIVMPVYNSEVFVSDAVKSILDQTYRDFELIIVDDASTDASLEIISGFDDDRIRIFENDKNRGIVYSRNRGLAQIRGEFYAPFDSDDVARKDKFEKQVEYLDHHPDVALVGSWARLISHKGRLYKKHWKLDAKPELIPSILLFRNYFVHSSIVVRKNTFRHLQYQPGMDVVEDYKFCADISFNHQVANYPAYLIDYRIHQHSAMRINNQRLFEQDIKIYRYLFDFLDMTLSDTDLNCIFAMKESTRINDMMHLQHIHDFLIRILTQNKQLAFLDHRQLQKAVANRWLKACYLAKRHPVKATEKLISSPLTRLLLKA